MNNEFHWDIVIANIVISFGIPFLTLWEYVGLKAAFIGGGLSALHNFQGLMQKRPNSPLRERSGDIDLIVKN